MTITDKLIEQFSAETLGIVEFRGELQVSIPLEKLVEVLQFLRDEPELKFNLLSDITAVDLFQANPRYELVYQLRSLSNGQIVTLKTKVNEDEKVPSVVSLWSTANWLEREIYDLMGIEFTNHPDLRRIVTPDHWQGHPLRKDYPLRGLNEPLYSPEDDLSLLETPKPGKYRTMTLNMGPQHPSTHGVLRLELELDGEIIQNCRPHIGYLHTGVEKEAEYKTYHQVIPMTDRLDYLAPMSNNLAYVLAVEKLCQIDIPKRAQYIRVLFTELTRIISHLVWLGTHALDLGAMSVFLYCFREREMILDMYEEISGVRMMSSYFRIGGVREDMTDGVIQKIREFIKVFPDRWKEYDGLLTKNPIFMNRTKGIGKLTAGEAIDLGLTGPSLRASGVNLDFRRAQPYSGYEDFQFEVITHTEGDVYARYLVRMRELMESLKIVQQAVENLPQGPYQSDNRKFVPPPKTEAKKNMEQIIHHFLLYSEGFKAPVGSVYHAIESPKGELGVYLVSDGTNKPYRMHWRGPSFVNLQSLPNMAVGRYIADLVAMIGSIDIVLGEVDR